MSLINLKSSCILVFKKRLLFNCFFIVVFEQFHQCQRLHQLNYKSVYHEEINLLHTSNLRAAYQFHDSCVLLGGLYIDKVSSSRFTVNLYRRNKQSHYSSTYIYRFLLNNNQKAKTPWKIDLNAKISPLVKYRQTKRNQTMWQGTSIVGKWQICTSAIMQLYILLQ